MKKSLRTGVAVLGASAAILFGSSSAHAVDTLVDYDVTGSTHVASTNSSIAIGPAVMHSAVAGDGAFTGDMVLPGTRTEFKLLGFVPVTADVAFQPTKPTTGNLIRVGRTRVLESSSSYYVRLSNIKASIFPLFAGSNCRTKQPVVINANTPDGEVFDIASGGKIVGTYTIGDFQNCGLNTWLINSIIPGSGNTITLNLANGRLV
jgi:hypothetical protein